MLLDDPVMGPAGRPRVDVVATAKVDLAAGEAIDGLGGYKTYSVAENYDASLAARLLPMGLAESCKLTRDVPKDQALTYDDVEVPGGRTVDRLRAEQTDHFAD